MNSRLMMSLALLIGILAAGGLAYAGESDPNLCYAGQAWAGQCTTQRHWEAGWCYANGDAASCDSLYGDVAAYMAGLVSATSTNAQGVAGIAGGAQGQGFASAAGAESAKKRPSQPSQPQQPTSCDPGVVSIEVNAWLGRFYAKIKTCGAPLGQIGSGGTAVSGLKKTLQLGTQTCLIMVVLYARGDGTFYWTSYADPSDCGQLLTVRAID